MFCKKEMLMEETLGSSVMKPTIEIRSQSWERHAMMYSAYYDVDLEHPFDCTKHFA